ncbi:MAG: HAD hydrolase family protein [Planctomycetota bacterium]
MMQTHRNHTGRTSAGRFDAVICDIDGCLGSEAGGPLDLEALAAIADWNRRAQTDRDRPIVTLCSGRPIPFVEAMSRLIANESLPVIGEMGAWLFFPKENRHELDPAISADDLAAVAELAAFGRETLGPEGVTIQPGKAVSVTFWHEDTDRLRADVFPRVESLVAQHGWPFRVSMTWFYINCDFRHVSKATGIARFIRHTGLDPNRLAGIGDTMSDKAIRDAVAWFGCPANAADELKPLADVVSKEPEAAGVLKLFQSLG